MRVLICGGRTFSDTTLAWNTLKSLHAETPITQIIHGGARGADYIGGLWGEEAKVPVLCFRANWLKYGKAAGPIRNQKMLDVGSPDVVVAFPGGAGTADMKNRARKAGVAVIEVGGVTRQGLDLGANECDPQGLAFE